MGTQINSAKTFFKQLDNFAMRAIDAIHSNELNVQNVEDGGKFLELEAHKIDVYLQILNIIFEKDFVNDKMLEIWEDKENRYRESYFSKCSSASSAINPERLKIFSQNNSLKYDYIIKGSQNITKQLKDFTCNALSYAHRKISKADMKKLHSSLLPLFDRIAKYSDEQEYLPIPKFLNENIVKKNAFQNVQGANQVITRRITTRKTASFSRRLIIECNESMQKSAIDELRSFSSSKSDDFDAIKSQLNPSKRKRTEEEASDDLYSETARCSRLKSFRGA